MRINHGVEWTSVDRVAVEHIEIGLILLTDELAKNFFVLSAEILEGILYVSVVSKELNTLLEVKADILAKEGLEGILITDNFEFFCEPLIKTLEDVNEHLSQEVKNLEVVFLEGHLDIEACELAQVAIGV